MSTPNPRRCVHCGKKFNVEASARQHEEATEGRCAEGRRVARDAAKYFDDLPDGAFFQAMQDMGHRIEDFCEPKGGAS